MYSFDTIDMNNYCKSVKCMIHDNFLQQFNIFIKAMGHIVSNERHGFYVLLMRANITA